MNDRLIELERERAYWQGVHDAMKAVEGLDGNPLYQKAWKVARNAIKSMMFNKRIT